MSTAPTPSSSDDAPAVLVETRPGVVRLTLNRPAKGNALGLTMAREVLAAIAAAVVIVDVVRAMIDGRGAGACGTTAPILAARDSARIAWRRRNSSRISLRT